VDRAVDVMSVIEHWFAENRPEGACVVSDQDEPGTVMALCGRQQDAREIALALNNHRGAVETLRDISKVDHIDAVLDPARPLRIARAWLREHDAAGGQS
jgi:hypothetical protein